MPFKIESEDQAWDVLRRALDNELELDEAISIDFSDWPKLDVYLPSTPISGSISPTMMAAFVAFQESIYRSYTLLTADTHDLRTLSKTERARLEFRVNVKEGSSGYIANLAPSLEKIGVEAVSKTGSTEIAITVVSLALIVGGVTAFKFWLNAKTEQRKIEVDDAGKRQWLEAQQATLQAGTENMKILARAMESRPLLADFDAVTEEARSQLVKSVGEEGGGRLYGTDVGEDFASEVSSQKRRQGEKVRLVGNYRVAKTDSTSEEAFRVTLQDEKTGQEVVALLQEALASEQHREVIKHAQWSRTPFYAEMTASRLGSQIVGAVIVEASEIEESSVS